MRGLRSLWATLPAPLAQRLVVELFVASNLGFLALDVYVAHLANRFDHAVEWIPVAFSAGAPLLLAPGLVRRKLDRGWALWAGAGVGALAIVVGVAGLLFHLQSSFFAVPTFKNLVYTAPFIAPLSYAGLGLLLLLNRLEPADSQAHSRWVVLLALGGFIGNFGLSLADHAINGFFRWAEWIPVVAAAFGVSLLFMVCVKPRDRRLASVAAGTMLLEIVVGALGFLLHAGSLPAEPWKHLERVTHLAPPFAPLLFADLAVLALIGLFGLARPASESG